MKTLNSALAVIEVPSAALGYRALDLFTQTSSLEVLEASVHGSKVFSILVRGEKSQLETALKKVSASISSSSASLRDSVVIENISPEVVETYFSLHTTELGESLLVVECETLSGLFQAAQRAIANHNLKAIEIRNLRGDTPHALGLFSGAYKDCVAASEAIEVALENNARKGMIEVIQNPNANFRSFFNLANS